MKPATFKHEHSGLSHQTPPAHQQYTCQNSHRTEGLEHSSHQNSASATFCQGRAYLFPILSRSIGWTRSTPVVVWAPIPTAKWLLTHSIGLMMVLFVFSLSSHWGRAWTWGPSEEGQKWVLHMRGAREG